MLDTFNWEIEKARHCRLVKGGLDSQSSLSPEGSPTLNARAEFHVKNVSRGGQFITPPAAGFGKVELSRLVLIPTPRSRALSSQRL